MRVICETCKEREPKTQGILFEPTTDKIAQMTVRNHHKYFPRHKVAIQE